MRARCYHCQNAFDTDRFGVQRCPTCGTEVYLPDPAAAQAQPPAAPGGAPARSAVLFGVISVTLGTWVSLLFRYMTASATVNFVGQLTRRMGGRVETFPFSQVFQG